MADNHNTGEPVSIGGHIAGQLFATLDDADDVVAALRRRMEHLGTSHGLVEELAGMAEGSIGKYLTPLQTKRLTMKTLLRIGQVIGMRGLLVAGRGGDGTARRGCAERQARARGATGAGQGGGEGEVAGQAGLAGGQPPGASRPPTAAGVFPNVGQHGAAATYRQQR
jgi:hypothetical protein